MQVVSYALPALIAIGLLRHRRGAVFNPLARLIRHASTAKALRRLEQIQPTTGGYLEATPLTSFVTMALVGSGLASHRVVERAEKFLVRSSRSDGSWPIDTNLATWLSTLSVEALAAGGRIHEHLDETDRKKLNAWLIGQQHLKTHPYTGAAPGGWAWTDLDGGVPDADDTAGAVVALWHLGIHNPQTQRAAELGIYWLRRLTNRDGGIPTFCRGWGRLPFDRSSTDITAHTLRAFNLWWKTLGKIDPELRGVLDPGFDTDYLKKTQHIDGYWLPLWFGNQHDPIDSNPTYGTASVCLSLPAGPMRQRGLRWLLDNQNKDGGWGGMRGTPSTIEETSLALTAVLADGQIPDG